MYKLPFRQVSGVCAIVLLTSLTLTAVTYGDTPKSQPTTSVPVKDWKTDPQARLVFFAVLQGLYEDGVSDEVVNNIVPPNKKGKDKMRHSFVLGCPLCQPAFEAFCVYQARPRFTDGSQASNFGKGLSPEIKQGLLSKRVAPRLMTLRQPMKIWVERRLRSMKLSKEERKQWWEKMSERIQQGTKTLRIAQKEDPWYSNWRGYWGCAACLGSGDACKVLVSESRLAFPQSKESKKSIFKKNKTTKQPDDPCCLTDFDDPVIEWKKVK